MATFNIQHGRRADGSGVDVEAVGRSCAALDADVLAVQEVDVGVGRSGGVDQVAAIADATGLSPAFVPTIDLDGGRYGHALFARGEITEVKRVALDTAGAEPRVALVADVLLRAEADLRIASVHLSVDERVARRQLQAVAARLDPALDGPTVVLGDSNLPRRAVRQVLGPHGFVVARSRPTFPASWPHRWIDHVAVGGGPAVGGAQVRRFAVSDHRALVVDVMWGRRAPR